jgi:hypothetical protein
MPYFLAGGPGKMEVIEILNLRDNKIYRMIDIYHFLVNGNQPIM